MPADIKQQIQEQIQQSSWEDWEKDKVLSCLPFLGTNTLIFLSQQMRRSDFDVIKNDLLTIVYGAKTVMDDLRQNKFDYTLLLMAAVPSDKVYDFGLSFFPIFKDIKDLIIKRKIDPSRELLNALGAYQIIMLHLLSADELHDIVKNNLLYFIKNSPLVMEIKRRFYYDNFAYPDREWSSSFLKAMEANQEIIGSSELIVDGKKQSGTVTAWIKDFIASSSQQLNQRSTFDVVQYFNKSQNAKKVDVNDRKLLAEVFKLYSWLNNPSISGEEVDNYERQYREEKEKLDEEIRNKAFTKIIEQFDNSPVKQPIANQEVVVQSVKNRPETRVPRPSASLNVQDVLNNRSGNTGRAGVVFDEQSNVKMEEISQRLAADRQRKQADIDKKLEELKKRKV
jgi:hypothetical protein